jgi:hypothetical protein
MKAIGVLIIGLGLILVVIGIQGTQGSVLTALKSVNPKLRTVTQTTGEQPANASPATSGIGSNAGQVQAV